MLLVSVHIPKTAGTSFRRILQSIPNVKVFLDYNDKYLASNYSERKIQNMAADLERNEKILDALKYQSLFVVVHGHFLATKYEHIFPDSKSIIWFRDPIDRLASHYFHWQRNPDMKHDICMEMHKKRMTLKDFAEFPPIRNIYFRGLCSKSLESFDFIGLTEYFEQSIMLFCRIFNLEINGCKDNKSHSLKKMTKKCTHYSIDDITKQSIIDNHQKDITIYQKAKIIFEEQCALKKVIIED